MKYSNPIDLIQATEYPTPGKVDGDYGWDAVLEYRVWGNPEPEAMDSELGSDYYFAFVTNADANECSVVPPEKPEVPKGK